jgi:uncharacterized protein YbjT (DUF2867 family)
MNPKKQAIVLGATGLVGGELLAKLLKTPEYDLVTVFVRKPIPEQPKLKQIILADFAAMDRHAEAFNGVEDVFCCLGTTIKAAGTRERFRQVDHDYPLLAANLAKAAGVRRYVLISSMGADAASKIFYSRVKGETENAIRALQLPMVSILRPSLLLGKRKDFRFGERAAAALSRPLAFLFRGGLLKYRPIEARDVAAVMLRVAQMFTPGVHVYENDQLHRMAKHPGEKVAQS